MKHRLSLVAGYAAEMKRELDACRFKETLFRLN